MVFLKRNLLIRVVIAIVIFYWKVNEILLESLKTDGLDKRTGFQNLASKVGCFEVKDEDTDFNVPNEYKLRVEKRIESFQKIKHELTIYGLSYVYHLIDLVKRPEQMLPPETWCKILECVDSNMNLKPDTPFGKYINYVSMKIDTHSPAIRFCFIKSK
ncbi:unnamed protein product [Aphis gossypii]|uniref:Uncharacterized protein n=1 Tax=Aphis gossypii TaxID=80765 RepID=A0A9P0J113_APHGO|nr:unnamed protein product [Aphis gossypii]